MFCLTFAGVTFTIGIKPLPAYDHSSGLRNQSRDFYRAE